MFFKNIKHERMLRGKPVILFLSQADTMGGAELYLKDFVNIIIENYQANIYLLGAGNHGLENITFIKRKTSSICFKTLFKVLGDLFFIWKKTIAIKPDLIITNTVRMYLLINIVNLFINKPIKIISIIHDFTYPRRLVKKVNTDLLIYASKTIEKHYPVSTRQKTIIFPSLTPDRGFKDIDFNKKSLSIGMIGRISKWKGQKEFLKFSEQLLKKRGNIEILIVGSPYENNKDSMLYYEELKDLHQNSLHKDQIKLLPHGNIDDYLEKVDISVHFSLENEPFGRVIIEAMSRGVLPVASKYGGGIEIIEDEKTGLIVDPLDINSAYEKLDRFLAEPNKMYEMSKNAYEKLKQSYCLDYYDIRLLGKHLGLTPSH
ncbi:glycosyltransferase family 4 protein [Deltaproteobacteria bacterium TL4]